MNGRAEREARIQTVSLLVLATIATATALHWLAPVMVPFVGVRLLAGVVVAAIAGFLIGRRRPRT